MIKKLLFSIRFFIVFAVLFCSSFLAFAQNCSVNAGTATTICPGELFNLKATSTGGASSIVWSQVGGPAVTITPTIAGEAKITNYIPGGVYRFRATTKCTDGSTVFQEVTYTVSDLTVANAGLDRVVCPGVVQLNGSPLKPGEIGRWVKISGNGPEPSNANIANPTLTFPVSTSSSKSTYTYTITNATTSCATVDEVTITNLGTAPVVDAGPNQDLSCYNITNSTFLNGSAAGRDDAAGQLGTWTFVSGPSNPTIANPNSNGTNVTGLVKGTYIFRWTVTGPCASGSDDVSIVVGDPNQNITSAGGNNSVYCDGRTTVLLSAPAAAFANEVVEWVKISGPGNPVITSPNSNVTTVTGLNNTPGTSYIFRYTIRNTVTGCSSGGNYTVTLNKAPTISISTASPYFAGCGQNFAVVNYSVDGGRDTRYALVSAPTGSTLETSLGGLNNYVVPPASGEEIRGFDKSGTYILRYRRATDGGIGGCEDAYAEVKIVISANIQASNAGTSQVLNCDIVETDLVGNVPLLGVGRWSQVSGPSQANIANPLDPGSHVTGLVPGKYTFRWLISGGDGNCTNAQSDVDVLVSTATRTASAAGSAQNTCAGIPVILDGNTPINGNEVGTWTVSPSAGIVFSDIHNPKASVTGLQAGSTYTFTWTITGACGAESTSSVTVTTNNTVAVTQANAGIDQCRATAGQITLAGNAPAGSETGVWTLVSGPSGGANFVNANLRNTQVDITQVGSYVFRWSITANGGCSPSTDEVLITVGTPTVATVGNAIQDCVGTGQITLSGNQAVIGTGTWTQTEGAGGAVITDIHNPTSTVTGLTAGRYKFRWTITGSSCSTSSSAELTVNLSDPPAPAIAGADQTICATSVTLDATPVSTGTGRWVVVSGPNIPTFANTANPRTSINNLVYGTYELQWITSGGLFCGDNTDNVTITVREAANAGADQNLCNVNSVSLNGNSNSTGTWTATNWPGYPAVTNQPTITTVGLNGSIATVTVNGDYTFRYTIADNGTCADFDEVTYHISTPPSIADAGPDQIDCKTNETPTTFQLAANTPVSGVGRWSLVAGSVGGTFASNNGVTDPRNDPSATFTPSGDGVSLLKWEISNDNCSGSTASSDYVRITMYYPPSDANLSGTVTTVNCATEASLVAAPLTRGFGEWTLVSQPIGSGPVIIAYPNASSTTTSGLEVGSYTFKWTATNGTCTSNAKEAQVTITVTTIPPVTANAGADQTLCFDNGTATTTLAGNTPGTGDTGLWTVQSGTAGAVTFANASSATTSVSFSQAGTYTLRWTTTKTTGGCTSPDDMIVNVVAKEVAVITTPNNSEFCWYTPVALDATTSTPNIGTWKAITKPSGAPDPVFSAPNGNHTEVFGLNVGTYQFSYTTNNGVCGDVNSNIVNIIIRELPTPSAAGISQTTCYNVYATLAAQNVTVGTGKWTVTGLPAGADNTSYRFDQNNDAAYNSKFAATVAGVYTLTWTTSNGACTSESTTQVTVQPELVGNQISISTTESCVGKTVNLRNVTSPSGGAGTYTYKWERKLSTASTWTTITGTGANLTPTLINATTGDLTYEYRRVVTSGNCAELVSNVVSVLVHPTFTISNNGISPATSNICFSGNVGTLIGGTPAGGNGNYTYQWQVSINNTTSYANVPTNGTFDGTQASYEPATFTNSTNAVITYNYRRVVSSFDCTVLYSTPAVITVNPLPTLTSSTTATVCSNSLFSYTPTSNITSGVTFNWTRAAVAGINANANSGTGSISETLVNNTANPIVVRYVYSLSANSCPNPDTYNVDVTVNPSPRGTNATVSSLTCANSTFSYDLQANVNAVLATSFPSNFTWTVAANPNVTGQSNGAGAVINHTLTNTTNVVQQVLYTITPTAQSGSACPGQPFTLTVTVPVCEGVTITKSTTRTAPITAAGEQIPYTIVVKNTGNAAQHNVVVNDPFLGGNLTATTKAGGNADNILDKGETWTYTGTYTVTQVDLDNFGKPTAGSGKIANTATLATTERPTPQTAGTDVAITANSSFTVAKTSGTALITAAGQVVPYTITVTNTGNTAISNVVVNDPMLTNITLTSGDINGNGIFERSENTWVFSGNYIVKQSDLDNNGNVTPANGRLRNTVSVSAKGPTGTSLTPVTSVFEIPVSTTAGSFSVVKNSTTTAITKAGQVVPYTITIANTGNTAVSNIQVIDPLLGAITNAGNLFSGDIAPKNNKLDVNETWTYTGSYTVTQTDIDNNGNNASNLGKLLNVAEVRGTYPNGTQEVKNTNQVLIDITPYAAYKIEKTSTETEVTKANDLIHYTVKVTNTGDAAIHDVVVSDPMVTNLARSSGDTNNNNKLDVNEVWTYTGTYTVKQTDIDGNGNGIAGILRNIATVNGKKPDNSNLNPETATHLIPLKTTTAFNVVKTANRTEVTTAGEQIIYSIAVTNTGVTAINNLVVNDPMLSNVPLLNPTKTNGNTDNILDLGEVWTYTGTYTVTQADIDNQGNAYPVGTLTNVVNVTGSKPDGSSAGSVSKILNLPINAAASLVLAKTSDVTTVNKAGDIITYTVTAQNTGKVAIENLLVDDAMLKLKYINGDNVPLNGKLDVGETWTYRGAYTVTQADIDNNGNAIVAGKLVNEVSASGRKPDGSLIPTPTPARNEVTITPSSGLAIVKATTATSITKAGQVVPYTIRVTNTGTVAVSNVVVNDPLITASALTLTYGDANANNKLDINETWIYEVNYTVKQSDIDNHGYPTTNSGELVNRATVAGQTPQGAITTVTSNDTSVPLQSLAAYSIEKTANKAAILAVGDVVRYTITVKNTGDAAISNVVVNDPMLSNAALANPATDANSKLDVGETWTYQADYTVKQSDIDNNGNTLVKGVLSNTATLSGQAPNNSALPVLSSTKVIPLTTSTSFTVQKTANKANVNKVGDVITYAITVRNTGGTAITNVVVNDPLTGGIIPTPKSGDDKVGGAVGVLDEGETWIYEATYTVKQSDIDNHGNSLSGGQSTAEGNILNLVTVTGTKPDGSSAGTITAQNEVPIVPTASFTLTKTSDRDGSSVTKAGDPVVYTVEVKNTGSVAINSLMVKDPMVNLIYASGDANTDGKLDITETWVYKGTYLTTQEDIDQNGNGVTVGKLVNVVAANGRTPNGNPVYISDVTATNSVTITANAAMTVKKATSTKNIRNAGQVVAYAITVANTGTVAIHDVKVNDPLLGGNVTTLYSGDVNGNGIMDVRETWTFTGNYTVTQADIDQYGNPTANSGLLVNTADAAGKLPDNSPITGISNTVSIPILLEPAYSIEKTSTTTEVTVANQVVPYVITIKNIGNSAIKDVVVNDPMLTNLAYANGDTNSDGKLDVSEVWTYQGSYVVTQGDIDNNGNTVLKGVLSNTASLNGNGVTGVALAPLTSTKIIPLKTSTLFTVTKTSDRDGGSVNKAGDIINYQIKVANTSVTAITKVVVNDPLLGGIMAIPTSGDVANPGVLDVNEIWTYTGSYTVTQADMDRNGNAMANNNVYANGSIINVVNVSGEKPDGTSAGRVTATNVVPIQPAAALNVTKTSDVATVNKAGDIITYTVKVTNAGAVAMNTIMVADPMVNLLYVNGDANNNGKLEVGEEWTYAGKYTVTQADLDNNGNGITVGKLVNEVSVQGRQPNGTLSPTATATANVDLVKASAMTISKTTTTTQITAAGQLVNYAITIANTGKSAISNVVVNDPLLSNLAYNNGDINANNKLDVNETWTYGGSYIIAQADIDQIKNAPVSGQFRNIASVTGTNPDGSAIGPFTSTKDIPVSQIISVDFKKVVTGQVGFIAGQLVNYEIKVINTGNTTLKNIVVTDPNATITNGSPIAQLNPGQTVLVLAQHVLTQADVDAGKVTNQAELEGLDPNGDKITKKSDDPSTATPNDPTVVQIVSPGSISLVKKAVLSGDGNTITYSFEVNNPGIVTLSDVTISDPKFSNPIAVVPSVLPPRSKGTATAVYTISAIEKLAGQVSNTAIVIGVMPNGFKVNDISGTNENNNEPTVVILPKITSQKTVADANGNGKIEPGEELTYTITISNDGDVNRTNVKVDDVLPAHTSYVNGSASNGGILNSGKISWNNLTVPAKSSLSVSFKVLIDATLPLGLTQIENMASVIDPAKPGEAITPAVSLPTEGKIESSKTVNDNKGNKDGLAQANEILTYNIVVSNKGGSLLTGVQVKDILPAGLTYVDGSADNAGTYTASSNQVAWMIDLAPGVTKTLTFDVKVTADVNAISKITNTASILSPTGQSLQPTTSLDTDPSADLEITKVLLTPAPVKTGDYVSYQITVKNLGQNKATGVTVTDPLPGTLDIPADIQQDKGTTNFDRGNKTLSWSIGDLELNEQRTMTFKIRVVAAGSLVNTATVTANQPDRNMSNNKMASGGQYVDGPELLIPNLFTPNGDGNNDAFEILGLNQYGNNELVIVNRWGNELFRAKNYQNNWTGEGLNEGTYYYLLRVQKNSSSEWITFKGYVTLIRAFKK